MKSLKSFFDSIEEKFVFPISRRTYQIIALITLIILGLSLTWLLYNSTPTGIDEVTISKSEVIQNQVDTTTIYSSKEAVESNCKKEEYNLWLDSLRKDLPTQEWSRLGDSIDVTVYNENYNYSSQENTEPEFITKKEFQPNKEAIPNLLNEIYYKRGIDTSDFCSKINIIESLHFLFKKTNREFKNQIFKSYFELLFYYPSSTKDDFLKSFELESGIELKEIYIEDLKTINLYLEYFKFYMEEKPSKNRIDLAVNTLKNHYKVGTGNRSKDREDYFKIASLIIKTNLNDEELTNALDGYNSEMAYYSQNGLYATIRKYLNLFEEKLSILKNKQLEEKAKKTEAQMWSLKVGVGAFLGVLLIANFLLIFSIQNIIKRHFDKK